MAAEVSISIPPSHAGAIRELAELSEQTFDTLVAAVTSYDGEYSASALQEILTSAVPAGDDLTSVLISAHSSLPSLGSIDAMAHAIGVAAGVSDVEQAASRFRRLFTAPAAFVIAKLLSLQHDEGRQVLVMRILTDARPAFGPEDADSDDPGEVMGIAVGHTLRIDSVHEGRMVSTLFSLSADQLPQLLSQVQRALKKADKVEESMEATGLHILRP